MRKLQKICIHWTAGTSTPTALDYQHYHYTVDWRGAVKRGKFVPQDNIPPLRNGRYAAHCGGGNSYCIGVSLCGMAGYKSPANPGRYPLTDKQCEAAWELVARLCIEHDIDVTPDTVFTHYEFGIRNPKSDSAGKIDITHLPYQPKLTKNQIGDFIRNKVEWYKQRGAD